MTEMILYLLQRRDIVLSIALLRFPHSSSNRNFSVLYPSTFRTFLGSQLFGADHDPSNSPISLRIRRLRFRPNFGISVMHLFVLIFLKVTLKTHFSHKTHNLLS